MNRLSNDGPREDGPRCRGCDEFFTMDEVQAGGHTCRISSADLEPIDIAHAQAGCLGSGWEVDEDGKGWVLFDDPLEARAVRFPAWAQQATRALYGREGRADA